MELILTDKKHSGFGITSFVLSIVTLILLFVSLTMASFIELPVPENINAASMPVEAMIAGMVYLLLVVIAFVSLGFGVIGLLNKDRKIVFSVIGLILSTCILIFLITLTVIGLSLSY
jgi:hypothetical protein